jgi:hypothetical protein
VLPKAAAREATVLGDGPSSGTWLRDGSRLLLLGVGGSCWEAAPPVAGPHGEGRWLLLLERCGGGGGVASMEAIVYRAERLELVLLRVLSRLMGWLVGPGWPQRPLCALPTLPVLPGLVACT